MTGGIFDLVRRANSSSAAATAIRQVIAGSMVCAGVMIIIRGLRQVRERVVIGLGGRWSSEEASRDSRQLDRLASESRVVQTLSWLLDGPSTAWSHATVKRRLDGILAKDLVERTRMSALIVIVAVITHTLILAALRVPVYGLGWGVRAFLTAVAGYAFVQPGPFAAAWSSRQKS